MDEPLAFRVVWAEPASCDLERIIRYLGRRNPAAAARAGDAILAKTAQLRQFPELGPVWKRGLPWRFLVLPPWRIYCRLLAAQQAIEISHIRHGARAEPSEDDFPETNPPF